MLGEAWVCVSRRECPTTLALLQVLLLNMRPCAPILGHLIGGVSSPLDYRQGRGQERLPAAPLRPPNGPAAVAGFVQGREVEGVCVCVRVRATPHLRLVLKMGCPASGACDLACPP